MKVVNLEAYREQAGRQASAPSPPRRRPGAPSGQAAPVAGTARMLGAILQHGATVRRAPRDTAPIGLLINQLPLGDMASVANSAPAKPRQWSEQQLWYERARQRLAEELRVEERALAERARAEAARLHEDFWTPAPLQGAVGHRFERPRVLWLRGHRRRAWRAAKGHLRLRRSPQGTTITVRRRFEWKSI
jgi:hypothetical protein